MSKATKFGLLAASAVLVAVGSYWYFSPYHALSQMRDAVKAKDGQALNKMIDYPQLRESFKGEFTAMMASKLGNKAGAGEAAASLMGGALATAMVNQIVDALVRPEMIMKMAAQQNARKGSGSGNASEGAKGDAEEATKWDVQRPSLNEVLAIAVDEKTKENGIGFVMSRTGFATWTVTGVRLPQGKGQKLFGLDK